MAKGSGGGWLLAFVIGVLVGLYLPDLLKDIASSKVKLQSPFVTGQ